MPRPKSVLCLDIDTVSPELMEALISSFGVFKWEWIHVCQRGAAPANEFFVPLNPIALKAVSKMKTFRLPEGFFEGVPFVAYIVGSMRGRKESDPFDFVLENLRSIAKGSPISGFIPKAVVHKPIIVTGQELEGVDGMATIITTVEQLKDFMAPPRPQAGAQPGNMFGGFGGGGAY